MAHCCRALQPVAAAATGTLSPLLPLAPRGATGLRRPPGGAGVRRSWQLRRQRAAARRAAPQRRHAVHNRGQPDPIKQAMGRGAPRQWVDSSSVGPPPSAHWRNPDWEVPQFDYSQKRYPESTFIGIDLGTTNSCVCTIEGGVPVVVPNSDGRRTTPTVVSLAGDQERYFGAEAHKVALQSPSHSMCSGKRLLGKALWDRRVPHQVYSEVMRLVQTDDGISLCIPQSFARERREDKKEFTEITYPVVHIMGMFMRHLKTTAEQQMRKNVTHCVVAVPAHFNDAQRKATEDAAVIAGLDVLEIIDEPSSAALAYSVVVKDARFSKKDNANLVVFDLGGGTFDMAVLNMDFTRKRSSILATGGDDLLGGDDFDRIIGEYWNEALKQQGVDVDQDWSHSKKLQRAAEECKIALDTQEEFSQKLMVPPVRGIRFINVYLTMTRFEYEELIQPLLTRLKNVIADVMQRSGLDPGKDVDDILLVGEMTRTPAILAVMRETFKQDPIISETTSPGTVVAMGAAVRADMIMKLLSGTPAEELPRITFDERSVQFEKNLSYGELLKHRARRWLQQTWESVSDRTAKRREHMSERAMREKMERGLTDEQIEKMSKEVVSMEMWMCKQKMCDRVIDEAEALLIDVSNWLDPRQSYQDDNLDEYVELLKFWLNVVRDNRSGEEQLAQAVWELRHYFDELSGGKSKAPGATVDKDPEQFLSNKNVAAPGEPIRVFTRSA